MAYTNTGFETAGASPGDAFGWTLVASQSNDRHAVFGTGSPALDAEGFEEEWDANEAYLFAFDPLVDIVAPLFDTDVGSGETFEDFEEGWSVNHGYSFTMGSSEQANFDSTPEDAEDFEEEWDANEAYSFTMGSSTAAAFDVIPESFEDFEEDWSNVPHHTTMPASTAAVFDYAGGGGEAFEDFEETWGPHDVSYNYAGNDVTILAHGLVDGDVVFIEAADGGPLPFGINDGTPYYVVNSTTDTFKFEPYVGGGAVSPYPNGSGKLRITRDPGAFWSVSGPT